MIGAQLKYQNVTLQFSTGERPTGVASLSDGSIDIAVGRKNNYDDDKGLPDGVTDNQPWHLMFAISLIENENTSKNDL